MPCAQAPATNRPEVVGALTPGQPVLQQTVPSLEQNPSANSWAAVLVAVWGKTGPHSGPARAGWLGLGLAVVRPKLGAVVGRMLGPVAVLLVTRDSRDALAARPEGLP